ncbi:MAG: Peptidyl-prolyl cis-trans isomerase B [Firmicutes bacterium ADurb.Bin182]|nr:MAG: Peptidyl-prolyl cis-trans isomerase B [Firmicutes bacterium ADurb.Bin182]
MKRFITLLICTALLFAGCSLAPEQKSENFPSSQKTDEPAKTKESPAPIDPADLPETVKAVIKVKEFGTIELELYPRKAPQSALNFAYLARQGFYDGLTFHRIMEGFMIQGGDPKGTGTGGPGYSIKGEFALNGFDNPISHERGVISCARKGDPYYDSAGSQFFIVHEDSTFLDGSYAAFGKVTSGIEVVDAIAGVPVAADGQTPLDKVTIESVTIEGPELPEPNKLK